MTPDNTATADSAEDTTVFGEIRRTPAGWQVHNGEELPDLLNAMVLADLIIAEEHPNLGRTRVPPRADPEQATEVERLQVTVAQLEHALHTRVVVEQAIGVLTERGRLAPRTAFEQLRHAARARGKKVADLARDVVASTVNPLTPLPAELARQGCAVERAPQRQAG
ncbi:ANTAR domain-containing protein [Salinactinospora qingdaonensis]|uniref:ANTAR domain-containing protein n=1 Tax=Salinactinospora qingdaonensis TaxID=702744 RepID=A0ABP7GLP0_9ACTN